MGSYVHNMGQVCCKFIVKSKKDQNKNQMEKNENEIDKHQRERDEMEKNQSEKKIVKIRRDSTDSAISSGSGLSPANSTNDEVFEYSLEDQDEEGVVVYHNISRPTTSSTNYSQNSKRRRKS